MKTTILAGKPIATKLKLKLKKEAARFKDSKIGIIYDSSQAASMTYLKSIQRIATEYDIEILLLDANQMLTSELIVTDTQWNKDDTVYGIIPILSSSDQYTMNRIVESIDWRKDIDCVTNISIGRFVTKQHGYSPCTAAAVMKLLEYYHIDISSKHVVIIGRSNVVGRPLIQLCLQKDATVTCCHSKTKNLEQITKMGDVLISAVGIPNFVKAYMVKDQAVVIDVGINYLNGKIVGDVDMDSVDGMASAITPVPGGIGAITPYMLLSQIEMFHYLRATYKETI
jgi:methylenetetrahydrofolate dehydrogenase (NADP+)/methenyltetrahydrofolate cyclohydrolase